MGYAHYTILGRQVGAHWLSIATLATVGGGSYLAMGGSKKEEGPALNAGSKDEESFIKNFIKTKESEEKAKA
ncbi:hypothetical protein P152DRAFT_398179 [Eremomyces bilateralis CBS 781.70]|uniref:ATP synthase subunit K, mitochondrial n=1 Tax=Eremomyces bilateralis CBS 781.70 TaxID=1392243 RepID=A0A6G1G1U8_9PEZI|nr:uncharacterized protein P152DRAFT_398179 [Eremomyces bilateralis CBS 781.70]KAF1812085.1 hypothetical protein P152DRAFT_398179 [Eremomyces bilateralis CBS 781.70]